MNPSLTVEHIETNRAALVGELKCRQGIVRDYVRAVAHRYATGLYLFGRPGTAKTHTVRDVLEKEVCEPYVYQRGHLTPVGLFELIAEHPNEIIVLDDLLSVFKSDVALQILLSALEHPSGADPTRIVKYRRKGETSRVAFRGGIVCITNRRLHDDEVLDAFKSRVNTLNYDPGDAHLGAMVLDAAARGAGPMSPGAATEVARYLIGEMLRLRCRFDLRLFFNKAVPSYQQWKDGETESDWRDLVTASIEEHLVAVRFADTSTPESRAAEKAADHAIVRQVCAAFSERPDRVREWVRLTGKTERTFYRRRAELQ